MGIKIIKKRAVQIIGFLLMFIGVGFFFIKMVSSGKIDDGDQIAIAFFITMLGISLAFPKLLEGNDGLSTMRIVVFMMVNVICILLIKIGWNEKVHSLSDIGLDKWWMGVIAFIFGAKATQSYFESLPGSRDRKTQKSDSDDHK